MEDQHHHPARKRGLFAGLRASFLTGLVVVLPIGLTIYLVYTVVGWIDSWILPLIPWSWRPEQLVEYYLGPEATFPVRGVGVIVFLVFTVAIGWIAKGLIGRSLIAQGEALVDRMPVVRSVYGGFKQITETFFAKSEKSFDKTCLVEFPRPGSWAVGFVATTAKGEIATKLPTDKPMLAVFVALTPLTSGILLYVPEEDVILLDMKADDAVKLIVSAGLVSPGNKDVRALLTEEAA
ncbi:DUF502 domain-containing protein [Gemmobacter fulvus]|uniref:DUF502 domain-containing protein n=1 Tax=Gemmobacter fulvus TaxID=2840474 RepID=A0A975P6G8_9RHOB|nr:DUF502 domain-containing protein [Gemmobacter fulvus]MBT9245136.1 DUF502 domain-containing protein [Gemmobacter fulvus]MDQ1848004.1 DUF502 domain-containing protein [Gemmobacter fulvus]QWK90525.1 DUF502 domain-containing protein [Gemmobacter fulvus]